MREMETDYLVVGAGASGMAFVDTLTAHADVDVVLIDRRHRPGGHWLDAYPFVRLHQPSANYGVASRPLGENRIDSAGLNAGYYERAKASEICDHFDQALADLVAAGRARFLDMSDYRGADGDGRHTVVSLLTGETTTIKVRKRFVDATYVQSEIPSRHTPGFMVDDGVRFVSPNSLVDLAEPGSGYTIIGAGKTAMDTCVWLLGAGVDPDRIRWIRPRDPWMMNRAFYQPLELVGSYMQMQGRWITAAAEASDGREFGHRMEAAELFVRLDPTVEPTMFRGPIVAAVEVDALRSIENVVRRGRIRRIGTSAITFDDGTTLDAEAGEVYVNCSAAGFRTTTPRPVFEPDRITLQLVTFGIVPWSAATQAFVEATRDDDAEKNRLCPPVVFTGNVDDLLLMTYTGMAGLGGRAMEPDVADWSETLRLNPAAGAMSRLDDPEVAEGMGAMAANFGPALENLARCTAA